MVVIAHTLCGLGSMAALIKAPRIAPAGIRLPHACPPPLSVSEDANAAPAASHECFDGCQGSLEPSAIDEANNHRIAELQASLAKELAEIDAVREASRAEGYAAGYREGVGAGGEAARVAGDRQILERLALLDELLAQTRSAFDKVLANAEAVIAAIVFEAVCKIVGRQLTTPEGVAAVVHQVVERAGSDACLSIRVAPTDFVWLQGSGLLPEKQSALAGPMIVEDSDVVLGGCVVTVANGEIDGRIETQFRNFAQGLKDAIRQR